MKVSAGRLLRTGAYLRKFDSYKRLILFTIGILTVVPGNTPLNSKIKNACLEKGRGEGILFPSLWSFLLIYLPCPPLKGDTPNPLLPHPLNSKMYFRSHLLLVAFPNTGSYRSSPSLYSNSNYAPAGDVQNDHLERW